MAATTTLLGLVTPTQGTLTGTWGDTVNYGISDYLDIAIAGTLAFAGDGAITLANTTGSSSGNSIGATTAQYAIIRVTGTLTTAKIITGPSYSKTYLVVNAATGSTVTFKASGQTGVSIAVGETALVYYNGTDYVKVVGTATAGAAGGSTTQVQYNNAGVLAGITGATTNGTALTLVAPVLGTPASGTVTNLTGTASININGTVGATTANTGAFSTLSATGNISATAGGFFSTKASGNSPILDLTQTGVYTWDLINTATTGLFSIRGNTTPFLSIASATGAVTIPQTLGVTGVSTLTAGAIVQGLTVGLGAGAVIGNTAVGLTALSGSNSGFGENTAIGSSALVTNTTGAYNTAVGSASMYNTTTAQSNAAVGKNTLYYNTTGSQNVAVGQSALQSNTTASNNTAVGYQAGYTNVTGTENTALGQLALYSNTASYNTALGRVAGYTNTTGANQVFVGAYAGYSNTSGGSNVAVGVQALQANTTASNNTAVGYQAAYSNTTGTRNVAVGAFSLSTVSTTADNTAVGYGALNATSGSSNTAFGSSALTFNTTAPSNTAVGYQAGYTQTTGSGGGSTFLGYRAGYSGNGYQQVIVGCDAGLLSTGSNNTFMGHEAGSTMTSGTGNTLLGRFNGNQDGLDIRALTDYIVLSDGNGARQITMKEGQTLALDSAVPNAGTGITFPASQSTSSNANTLDDYEEGTWNAATITGVNVTGTSFNNGYYTKIGNIVHVQGKFTLTVTTANTLTYVVMALPLAPQITTTGSIVDNVSLVAGTAQAASNGSAYAFFAASASLPAGATDWYVSYEYQV